MISFVITARAESPEVLGRTVDELRATTASVDREIIVVDDGTSVPVTGLAREVRILRHDAPMGSALSRREGCAASTGDILVVLDAHMTFEPGWLTRMLEHVASGALLCAAYWDYERTVSACYGADLEWCGERDYARGRFPGFHGVPRTEDPGAGATDVPMLLGACYMMLRTSYELLGGYSPLFRVWGAEEQDLSIRAWASGLAVRCVADARVGHLTRRAFPYPVSYDEVEFNQLAMIQSIFDWRTIRAVEEHFMPLSPAVRAWLESADVASWRRTIQRAKCRDDRELFAHLIPTMLEVLDARNF